MGNTKSFVPTRRNMRPAERLIVFEQRNGLWAIIEVHAVGSPRCISYANQSQRAAQNCVDRAARDGHTLIVWGDLTVPMVTISTDDPPLLEREVGA